MESPEDFSPEFKWEYIGDGVYVKHDGWGIWLHANSHDQPTDRVYLEPSVFDKLKNYMKRCDEQAYEHAKRREQGKDKDLHIDQSIGNPTDDS